MKAEVKDIFLAIIKMSKMLGAGIILTIAAIILGEIIDWSLKLLNIKGVKKSKLPIEWK